MSHIAVQSDPPMPMSLDNKCSFTSPVAVDADVANSGIGGEAHITVATTDAKPEKNPDPLAQLSELAAQKTMVKAPPVKQPIACFNPTLRKRDHSTFANTASNTALKPRVSINDDDGSVSLNVGCRGLARWKTGYRWFPATVVGIRDSCLMIQYDDGDEDVVATREHPVVQYIGKKRIAIYKQVTRSKSVLIPCNLPIDYKHSSCTGFASAAELAAQYLPDHSIEVEVEEEVEEETYDPNDEEAARSLQSLSPSSRDVFAKNNATAIANATAIQLWGFNISTNPNSPTRMSNVASNIFYHSCSSHTLSTEYDIPLVATPNGNYWIHSAPVEHTDERHFVATLHTY